MSEPLATERQRVLYEAREIWRAGFVTFDTETTGLESWDEIIQWAICDQEGQVLGQGYIKPTIEISMDAQEIHGISQEQVADAPTFEQVWLQIRALLEGKHIVIYNADFDIRLLWQSGEPYKIDMREQLLKTTTSHCAMELFSRLYGEYSEWHGSYRWQRLTTAIDYLGIEVPGQAHDASYDAAATAMVIKRLAELADQELPAGWHPPVPVKCAGGCFGSKECAEPDDIWYCVSCGVKAGIYHRCPGCTLFLDRPAIGILCDDLCEFCMEKLEREKMLLLGKWHYCPGKYCSLPNIVQSPDLDEQCEHCQRQEQWKREAEGRDRERNERMARQRKEARKASQARYRERRKERDAENKRRAEQGLPPLEKPQRSEPEQEFTDNGHHFTRGKDAQGLPIVTCSLCLQTWRRPPVAHCLKLPTFAGWECKPKNWHTRTQLGKMKMQADWSKPAGYVVTMKDTYPIYNQATCTPVEKAHKKQTSSI
jgi:DNA polymerase III epsilon subunit-like protein